MSVPGSAIVVLAGGVGTRVGADVNKTLLTIGGVAVVARSVQAALDAHPHRVVVVVRPEERSAMESALTPVLGNDEIWLVDGGVERHDSEWHALQALAPLIEAETVNVIALHDAARPLVQPSLFETTIEAARAHGGAIPVREIDHLRGSDHGSLVAVQTPQAFRAKTLLACYRRASEVGFHGTDTAACVERFSDLRIIGVPGAAINIKVTYPEDIALAGTLLKTGPFLHH